MRIVLAGCAASWAGPGATVDSPGPGATADEPDSLCGPHGGFLAMSPSLLAVVVSAWWKPAPTGLLDIQRAVTHRLDLTLGAGPREITGQCLRLGPSRPGSNRDILQTGNIPAPRAVVQGTGHHS